MAFADAAQLHASSIAAGPFGETISYRMKMASVFVSVAARVERNPVDPVGGVLANTIHVFVPKGGLVTTVSPREDVIQLAQTATSKEPPEYRVMRVLSSGPGHWYLEAKA